MTGLTQYILTLGGAAALFFAVILHLRSLRDYHEYEFRNVMIAALIPFTLAGIIFLAADAAQRGDFSFGAFLIAFPARFANLSIALYSILAIAMAVSNIALIRHEGMAFGNTVGTLLELGWILATIAVYALVCVLKAISGDLSGAGRFLCGWVPYFLYWLIDYGECITVGIMIMGWIAAHGKSAYDKDFIIIPGCSISKTGGLLPLLRGRVDRAVRYAWEQEIASGRPVRFIPSGGQGADEIMSEGSAMELYLLSHSAEDYEVIPEKKSANTAENFLFSARIIKDIDPNAKAAFATTNYHVLRCGMLARKAGLKAEGLASGTRWYFWPNGFAREVAAIVKMTERYHIAAALILFVFSLLLFALF